MKEIPAEIRVFYDAQLVKEREKGAGLLLTLVCRILFLMISVVHFDEPPRILSHNVFNI